METIDSVAKSKPVFIPPTSVQPGGGLCVSLELAWGRLRRSWLRRFRSGYVQQMAAKRQGECQNCHHDIIDARDLKYVRNICGFWFREEDDRFLWRGRLGLTRIGLVEVICSSIVLGILFSCLVIAGFIWTLVWLLLPIVAAVWFLAIYFFRDPERVIPADANALVSPADGTVTDVGEVAEPDFPGGRAFRVGIFLSIFSVHVNRIPRSGRVVGLRYYPGSFLDARRPEAALRNEQLWIDLEETDSHRLVRVKQISGAVARRIVCWLKLGESVQKGQRLGMIKFGSRTEVYVPMDANLDVKVAVGDKVRGGATVLLRRT